MAYDGRYGKKRSIPPGQFNFPVLFHEHPVQKLFGKFRAAYWPNPSEVIFEVLVEGTDILPVIAQL